MEFCQRHYHEHREDIKDKKPWVKALKNDAQRERRRNQREYENTSLDAMMDSYDNRTRQKNNWR